MEDFSSECPAEKHNVEIGVHGILFQGMLDVRRQERVRGDVGI